MSKINVKINGNDIELEYPLNVSQMLEQRNVTGKMFVVEKNREIVTKEDYAHTTVEENDVFEIVGFFGGG